jgi:hypothetical protein
VSKQPEALSLADYLDLPHVGQHRSAAELRRLYAVNAELVKSRDGAYTERNLLVALLSTLFPSGKAKTAIEGWDKSWHGCVYIDFPWGQASWHFHDSEAHLFAHLPPYQGQWDGHTTEQKYDSIRAALAEPNAKSEPVAWMYVNSEGECEQIEYETPPAGDDSITPLYAAPPKPPAKPEPVAVDLAKEGSDKTVISFVTLPRAAKREPANLTQIAESYRSDGSVVPMYWVDGWKAAERFHNIRAREQQPTVVSMSGAEATQVLTDEIGCQPCRYPACVDDSGRCARLFAGECAGPKGGKRGAALKVKEDKP